MPDNSVDVIIPNNCVINPSADKDRGLRMRSPSSSGRAFFAVPDVVTRGEMPQEIRKRQLLWIVCVVGAPEENKYRSKICWRWLSRYRH